MKNSIIITAIVLAAVGLLFLGLGTSPKEETPDINSAEKKEQKIEKAEAVSVTAIEHSTAVITLSDTTVYVDPLGGGVAFDNEPQPNLILITDIHGDHLNVSTLLSVTKDDTVIVAPQAVAQMLPEVLRNKTVVINNGEKTEQKGVSIEAIPMYNLPESADEAHVKGRGNGYVLEKDGMRVYVAGDTADIPEMRALTNIDVALIPMNLPFTMSVERAADAVLAFAPTKVYPYHYKTAYGFSDIEKFKQLVQEGNQDINVVLLDWYPLTQMSNMIDSSTIKDEQTTTDELLTTDEPKEDTTKVEAPSTIAIEISGTNYAFDVKEITVKKGDTVHIFFKNKEGFHDWVVDEFDAHTKQITQGQTTEVTFVADKEGMFEYYCSVGNHRAQGMVGTLIVE